MGPPKKPTSEFDVYTRIAGRGVIGNSQTAALVGNDGSIYRLCRSYVDSPTVFGTRFRTPGSGGVFIIGSVELRALLARVLIGGKKMGEQNSLSPGK